MVEGGTMKTVVHYGNIAVTVTDYETDDFMFLQQGALAEGAKEYSHLKLDAKYEYCVVFSYNDIPYMFFLICDRNRYGPSSMRVYTKMYTIPQFRLDVDVSKYMLPGDTAVSVRRQTRYALANFVEEVLPQTDIEPCDFYFYSRAPSNPSIVPIFNRFAKVPWTVVEDRLFLTGKKESDPRSWKYIIYKGDLSKFAQPSKLI